MAVKSVIYLTHGNEQYTTIVNKLLHGSTLVKREMVALRNFFHATAGEDRAALVSVQVDTGDAVYASQTVTVSTGVATDTVVVNGTTLTCVDHRDTTNITYAADSSGSKNSKYYLFQDQTGQYKYYVWFNINAAGVDPEIAGRVGIKISGATNATAATLGAATTTACAATDSAKVTFGADSAGSLNNTYFTFRSLDGQRKGYFWFNINAAGVDPAPAGYAGLGIQVAGATNATAATLATAAFTAAAVKGAIKGFYVVNPSSGVINIFSSVDDVAPVIKDSVAAPTNFVVVQAVHGVTVSNGASGHVILTNNDAGSATAAADGAATSTGFTFTHSITGSAVTSSQYNVGFTDTGTAANIAAAVNTKMVWVATATSAAAVVTVSAFFPGPAGNAITLTASGGNSAGGAVLASGALPTTVSSLNTYHSGV